MLPTHEGAAVGTTVAEVACFAIPYNLGASKVYRPEAPYLLILQDQIHHLHEAGIGATCFSANQDYSEVRQIMDG